MMNVGKYRISSHAARRMAQRNLDLGDLALVLRFGRAEYRAGAKFYFLCARDVPEGMKRALEKLVGTTVVIEGDAISTVYRNRQALRRIKRKLKWQCSSASCRRRDINARVA
jgi:hypothetical protein